MPFMLDASCLCNTGKVRKNNEDNFFFDGRCLEAYNNGMEHPITIKGVPCHEKNVAVFDGMGGENFGELASYTAADCMLQITQTLKEHLFFKRKILNRIYIKINDAVVAKQQELCTNRMGSTMVAIYFSHGHVYVSNIGDSRAYRLRAGKLSQLSVDHVEKREGLAEKKAPLTQHLGISSEDFLIEPFITKSKLRHKDQYLLCSDGLTDMLSEDEISRIMSDADSAEECVEKLVDSALDAGGRDNVTTIVCRIL